MDHDDYYDVLGLDFASSTSDVVKAYKAKALIHHPDKGGMVGTFIRLKAARDTLSDTALRMTYDTKCSIDLPNGHFVRRSRSKSAHFYYWNQSTNHSQAQHPLRGFHLTAECLCVQCRGGF